MNRGKLAQERQQPPQEPKLVPLQKLYDQFQQTIPLKFFEFAKNYGYKNMNDINRFLGKDENNDFNDSNTDSSGTSSSPPAPGPAVAPKKSNTVETVANVLSALNRVDILNSDNIESQIESKIVGGGSYDIDNIRNNVDSPNIAKPAPQPQPEPKAALDPEAKQNNDDKKVKIIALGKSINIERSMAKFAFEFLNKVEERQSLNNIKQDALFTFGINKDIMENLVEPLLKAIMIDEQGIRSNPTEMKRVLKFLHEILFPVNITEDCETLEVVLRSLSKMEGTEIDKNGEIHIPCDNFESAYIKVSKKDVKSLFEKVQVKDISELFENKHVKKGLKSQGIIVRYDGVAQKIVYQQVEASQ